MSRPVPLLFRRVSPALSNLARDLVPATAAMGTDVASPEDVLRFAVEVGLVVLKCAADPGAHTAAARLVKATLAARARHPEAPPLREER